jgi:hypothetical protein
MRDDTAKSDATHDHQQKEVPLRRQPASICDTLAVS